MDFFVKVFGKFRKAATLCFYNSFDHGNMYKNQMRHSLLIAL